MADDDARTEIEGERTITPVSGRSRGPLGPLGKGIVIVALIGGVFALLWFTANAPRTEQVDAPPKGPVRQTVVLDEAKPSPESPRAPALPGPPEDGPPPASKDDPYEASRRAPVLGWKASGGSNDGDGQTVAAAALPSPDAGREETSLDAARRVSKIGTTRAHALPDPDFLLTAGTILPCTLETAIDTTTPGYVTCLLPRDLLSASGHVVLLEKGTKVLGEYRAGLRQGQERIFVVWNRAVTPKGIAIDLGSPATDAVGRAGFDGEVETYFWTRFGGALMVSLIGDLVAYGTNKTNDRAASARSERTSDQALAEATRDAVGIPPVLRKNQGEAVSILLANDLDFSGIYGLALR